MNELLGAVDERLEEVDGHALVGGKVRVALHVEEEVSKELIRLMKGTYTSRFERYLAAKVLAVIFYNSASSMSSTIVFIHLILIITMWALQIIKIFFFSRK